MSSVFARLDVQVKNRTFVDDVIGFYETEIETSQKLKL